MLPPPGLLPSPPGPLPDNATITATSNTEISLSVDDLFASKAAPATEPSRNLEKSDKQDDKIAFDRAVNASKGFPSQSSSRRGFFDSYSETLSIKPVGSGFVDTVCKRDGKIGAGARDVVKDGLDYHVAVSSADLLLSGAGVDDDSSYAERPRMSATALKDQLQPPVEASPSKDPETCQTSKQGSSLTEGEIENLKALTEIDRLPRSRETPDKMISLSADKQSSSPPATSNRGVEDDHLSGGKGLLTIGQKKVKLLQKMKNEKTGNDSVKSGTSGRSPSHLQKPARESMTASSSLTKQIEETASPAKERIPKSKTSDDNTSHVSVKSVHGKKSKVDSKFIGLNTSSNELWYDSEGYDDEYPIVDSAPELEITDVDIKKSRSDRDARANTPTTDSQKAQKAKNPKTKSTKSDSLPVASPDSIFPALPKVKVNLPPVPHPKDVELPPRPMANDSRRQDVLNSPEKPPIPMKDGISDQKLDNNTPAATGEEKELRNLRSVETNKELLKVNSSHDSYRPRHDTPAARASSLSQIKGNVFSLLEQESSSETETESDDESTETENNNKQETHSNTDLQQTRAFTEDPLMKVADDSQTRRKVKNVTSDADKVSIEKAKLDKERKDMSSNKTARASNKIMGDSPSSDNKDAEPQLATPESSTETSENGVYFYQEDESYEVLSMGEYCEPLVWKRIIQEALSDPIYCDNSLAIVKGFPASVQLNILSTAMIQSICRSRMETLEYGESFDQSQETGQTNDSSQQAHEPLETDKEALQLAFRELSEMIKENTQETLEHLPEDLESAHRHFVDRDLNEYSVYSLEDAEAQYFESTQKLKSMEEVLMAKPGNDINLGSALTRSVMT